MAKLPDAQRLLNDLAEQIRSDPQPGTALVGIYTGGVRIAERLQQMLALPTPMGTIDVAFWRDDYKKTGMRPGVKPSDIRFEVEGAEPAEALTLDPRIESDQVARLQALRAARDGAAVEAARRKLVEVAAGESNTMPAILACVRAYVTLGEISDSLRAVFGEHRDPTTG